MGTLQYLLESLVIPLPQPQLGSEFISNEDNSKISLPFGPVDATWLSERNILEPKNISAQWVYDGI